MSERQDFRPGQSRYAIANAQSGLTCCGAWPPGRRGEAMLDACQLCPASPAYWKLPAVHRNTLTAGIRR